MGSQKRFVLLGNLGHAFCFLVLLLSSAAATGQEKEPPQEEEKQQHKITDELVDIGDNFIAIQSDQQFREHASELGEVFGARYVVHSVLKHFKYNTDAYDLDRPIIWYFSRKDGYDGLIQLPVKSREAVENLAVDKVADGNKPFYFTDPKTVWFDGDFGGSSEDRESRGVLNGNRFGILLDPTSSRKDDEKAKEFHATFAERPAMKLDQATQDLINRGGMVGFAKFPKDEVDYADISDDFTEDEKEVIKKIGAATATTKHSAVSLTYENKVARVEGIVAFTNGEPMSELIDFAAASRPFQPTLGLDADDLLTSVSFQIDALKSPELVRIIPKILDQNSSLFPGDNQKWLEGRMMRVANELLADSWQDVKATRLALYPSTAGDGSLTMIAIVDPKDPDQLLNEFAKLVKLVEPTDTPQATAERNVEIESLIQQLESDQYSIRNRATNRLILAGKSALEALKAAENTGSVEKRVRIKRILDSYAAEQKQELAQLAVEDISFWANLRPEFRLDATSSTYEGYPSRVLHVLPDPTKNEEQVATATKAIERIFGSGWNRFRIVRVNEQFVCMFGSDEARFKKTLKQLAANQDPIADLAVNNRQPIRSGNVHIHASMGRIADTFYPEKKRFPYIEKQPEPVSKDNLSTLTINLAEQHWRIGLYLPDVEILHYLRMYYFLGL